MSKLVFSICMAAVLAGCASSRGAKPPVCDGKHRRAANPYGSVLAPGGPVAPAAAPASAAQKPAKVSAVTPTSFPSCG